jgi:hypothetical protein
MKATHREDDLADPVALAGIWEVERWVDMMPQPY